MATAPLTITAEQAARQLQEQVTKLNEKEIIRVDARLKASGPPVYIYSVCPWPHIRYMGSMGTNTIRAKAKDKRYSEQLVIPFVVPEALPTDLRKMTEISWMGTDVALDIIGKGPTMGPDEDRTQFGVFISAGPVPTDEEIARAEEQLMKTAERLVLEADTMVANGEPITNITSMHRWASNHCHQIRKWNETQNGSMKPCKGCGTPVRPDVAKCVCGAILNWELALELDLISEDKYLAHMQRDEERQKAATAQSKGANSR